MVKCIEVRKSRNKKADYEVIKFQQQYHADDTSFESAGILKTAVWLAPKGEHRFEVGKVYTGRNVETRVYDEPQWGANEELGIKAHEPLDNGKYYRNVLVVG